jgi:hypothetical protein
VVIEVLFVIKMRHWWLLGYCYWGIGWLLGNCLLLK